LGRKSPGERVGGGETLPKQTNLKGEETGPSGGRSRGHAKKKNDPQGPECDEGIKKSVPMKNQKGGRGSGWYGGGVAKFFIFSPPHPKLVEGVAPPSKTKMAEVVWEVWKGERKVPVPSVKRGG